MTPNDIPYTHRPVPGSAIIRETSSFSRWEQIEIDLFFFSQVLHYDSFSGVLKAKTKNSSEVCCYQCFYSYPVLSTLYTKKSSTSLDEERPHLSWCQKEASPVPEFSINAPNNYSRVSNLAQGSNDSNKDKASLFILSIQSLSFRLFCSVPLCVVISFY